jgi:hypothetical protein
MRKGSSWVYMFVYMFVCSLGGIETRGFGLGVERH